MSKKANQNEEYLEDKIWEEVDYSKEWNWNVNETLSRIPIAPLEKDTNRDWCELLNGKGERIDKALVHKVKNDNVLLSKPLRIGEIIYFNTRLSCDEFRFDHPSDHLEGMLIIEAVRQAGLATLHLSGIPLSSVQVMLNFNIRFNNMVELNQPVIIRTTSNISSQNERNGQFWVAFEILQSGRNCASGGSKVGCYTQKLWKKIRRRMHSQKRISLTQFH